MKVDSSMQGKNTNVKWSSGGDWTIYLKFLDENKQILNTVSRIAGNLTTFDDVYTVHAGTKWIMYTLHAESTLYERLYEVEVSY
jgi:hypothetical protein